MIGNAINKLYMASSEKRLECFLYNCSEVQAEGRDFWPIFTEMWSMCDSTWEYRNAILKLLRKHAKTRATCDRREDEMAFYNELPERITVYRGCSKMRQRGLAWTTERGVAEGFAKGLRQIEVPEPVVLKCVVPKSVVLATFAFDRNESEVLLDYLRLPRIMSICLVGGERRMPLKS
jgi:hypothetical protein